MKYKIVKGSQLFDKLTNLRKRMDKVNAEATKLAIEFGGEAAARSGNTLAGGIDAVQFKEKPDGWRKVGNSWDNLYYPKVDKKNKDIHSKILALPDIKFDELNGIVAFTSPQTVSTSGGFAWIKSVGMQWHKDFVLMETAEGTKYKPIEGVIEILGSEYDLLQKKIKD